MSQCFSSHDPDFPFRLERILNSRRLRLENLERDTAKIIARVQSQGDAGLRALTRQYDGHEAIIVDKSRRDDSADKASKDVVRALEHAIARVEDYHRRLLPKDFSYQDAEGVFLGARYRAVDSAGLYVPGGRAAYPSSLVMSAVPARVAGVQRLVMAVPMPGGEANPAVMAAARRLGIDEIYAIGGAQAVAALACGTESLKAVDMIAGPGNAWVSEAKRQFFGRVGIDLIAGPTEIVIIADAGCAPDSAASDLLAQSEHDPDAQAILITDNAEWARQTEQAVQRQLLHLPRRQIAESSWRAHGAILIVENLSEAAHIANRFAPEHLSLAVAEPEALLTEIRHAGAIFLGYYTPEAVGDYIAGPSHILPTGRAARFSSGLGVENFLRRSTLIACTHRGLQGLAENIVCLAEAEKLTAHARSVAVRLAEDGERKMRAASLRDGGDIEASKASKIQDNE